MLKRSLRQNQRRSNDTKLDLSSHYEVLSPHQVSCKSAGRLWRNIAELAHTHTHTHNRMVDDLYHVHVQTLSTLITPHWKVL